MVSLDKTKRDNSMIRYSSQSEFREKHELDGIRTETLCQTKNFWLIFWIPFFFIFFGPWLAGGIFSLRYNLLIACATWHKILNKKMKNIFFPKIIHDFGIIGCAISLRAPRGFNVLLMLALSFSCLLCVWSENLKSAFRRQRKLQFLSVYLHAEVFPTFVFCLCSSEHENCLISNHVLRRQAHYLKARAAETLKWSSFQETQCWVQIEMRS